MTTIPKSDIDQTTSDVIDSTSDIIPNAINVQENIQPSTKDDETNIHIPKNVKLQINFVCVKNASLKSNIAYYDIQVSTSKNIWHTTKRYSQFEAMHNQLLSISRVKLPLLPSKHYKLFTDHTKKRFIEKRRALFDNYCRKLIQSSDLKNSQTVVNFFNESKTNVQNKSNVNSNSNSDISEDVNDENEKGRSRRQSEEYGFPENQEITHIEIQTTRKMSDHVLYQIIVSNSHLRNSFRCWTVLKRFTQFYDMDVILRQTLQHSCPHILAQLPPNPHRKFKFVHNHMDDNFIEERRVIMENYLAKLLRFPEVANDEQFLCFLGVE